jgi:hypothetical protein
VNTLSALRPGDWLTLLGGGVFCAWLTALCWNGGAADRAIVRSGGKIFRELPLAPDVRLQVPGPLGVSIITIHDRQVRIESDPSPRQYCVRQGWLKQAGEIALCLPNEISVELAGRSKRYDSLNY